MAKRFVSRKKAAAMLKMSVSNVRRLEIKGDLPSDPDTKGNARYSRYLVEKMARQRGISAKLSDEQVARVFELLKAGKKFAEIVIETRFNADEVERAVRRYHLGFDPFEEKRRVEEEEERELSELHAQQMAEMERAFQERREKSRLLDEAEERAHLEAQELADFDEALLERFGNIWGDDGDESASDDADASDEDGQSTNER